LGQPAGQDIAAVFGTRAGVLQSVLVHGPTYNALRKSVPYHIVLRLSPFGKARGEAAR